MLGYKCNTSQIGAFSVLPPGSSTRRLVGLSGSQARCTTVWIIVYYIYGICIVYIYRESWFKLVIYIYGLEDHRISTCRARLDHENALPEQLGENRFTPCFSANCLKALRPQKRYPDSTRVRSDPNWRLQTIPSNQTQLQTMFLRY